MAAFAQAQDASAPDVLIAAWDRAVAGWDEPARHDEVIRLVAQHDAYAWAAARYRTRTGDPIGDRQLERVRKAAEVTLYATQTRRPDRKPGLLTAMIILLIIVAVVALLMYTKQISSEAEDARGPAPPAGRLQLKPVQPLPRQPAEVR
ncbi:MAG: hypothetical protein H6Q90_6025 [Deltaproteobacteria bacterium]|nr:hypothetical protein [Deltaproteobacteria bacterium]